MKKLLLSTAVIACGLFSSPASAAKVPHFETAAMMVLGNIRCAENTFTDDQIGTFMFLAAAERGVDPNVGGFPEQVGARAVILGQMLDENHTQDKFCKYIKEFAATLPR